MSNHSGLSLLLMFSMRKREEVKRLFKRRNEMKWFIRIEEWHPAKDLSLSSCFSLFLATLPDHTGTQTKSLTAIWYTKEGTAYRLLISILNTHWISKNVETRTPFSTFYNPFLTYQKFQRVLRLNTITQ